MRILRDAGVTIGMLLLLWSGELKQTRMSPARETIGAVPTHFIEDFTYFKNIFLQERSRLYCSSQNGNAIKQGTDDCFPT